MKDYYLILFIFISFIISKVKTDNEDETRGCVISEKEGVCCWLNNNGCCAPPKEGTMCTQAFTNCCKIKKYDEKTNTYEYEYKHDYENDDESESDIPIITVDGNYIKIIKFNLLLFISILF